MKKYLQLACSARIVLSSLQIAFVVGSLLNLINQSDAIFNEGKLDFSHIVLNYIVPYCVSTFSAVKNELDRRDHER